MSDLSKVVDYINASFKAGNFSGKPFQKSLFHGLAKQVDRVSGENKEKIIIKYDDKSGKDATAIVPNDIYPMQLYHRYLSQEVDNEATEEFYGDDDEQKIITFTLGLVVFASKFNLELSQEKLVTAIAMDFPANIKPSKIPSSQFSDCGITLGKVESDSTAIFSNEYGKVKSIPQEYIFLSFEYEIKMTYSKKCFTLC
jgi:hypothetical protein